MPNVTMTLNQIRAVSPCREGWATLLSALGKTEADDDPIELSFILKSNGIQDATWCMRVNWFEHKKLYMQFVNNCVSRAKQYAADVANAAASTAASASVSAYAAANAAYAASTAANAADAAANAADAAYAAAYAADAADADASADASAYAERQKQKNDLLQLLQEYSQQ